MDVAFIARNGAIAFALICSLAACGNKTNKAEFVEPASNKAECSAAAVPNQFVIRWKDGSTSVEKAVDRQAFLNTFFETHKDAIDFAEHDYVVELSEPGNVQSNYYYNPEETADWGQKKIAVSDAWNQGYKGEGIIVAVIDSGVDIQHPQLSQQLAINSREIPGNGIDDDGNGYIDDVSGFDFELNSGYVTDGSGHGTHVAGVVLADHSAGPVQGIAPKAKLLPIDFMNNSGAGNISDAIRGMYYASSMGAKVVNASWGGAPCSRSLQTAIEDLGKKGVLFVVASGNSGVDLDLYPEYPAAFGLSNQITVGSSSVRDYMDGFSNFSSTLVNIMAPGSNIYSTYPFNRTKTMSGTSMASPFVAGAAAILWGAKPDASVTQVRDALLNSVDTGNFDVSSRGRLNISKALRLLLQN